jgi:hypothetical protein
MSSKLNPVGFSFNPSLASSLNIEYAFHPDGDWIDLITVHKGGLFGTDYRICSRLTASRVSSASTLTR